jgi:hypothetical protein
METTENSRDIAVQCGVEIVAPKRVDNYLSSSFWPVNIFMSRLISPYHSNAF